MTDISVGFGWNSYQTCGVSSCNPVYIEETGIMNWSDANVVVSVFFYVAAQTILNLSVVSEAVSRNAELSVSVPSVKKTFKIQFEQDNLDAVNIGSISIKTPGYVKVDFKGTKSAVNKQSGDYPILKHLVLSGLQDDVKVNYVQDSFSSHFGRRGPSVHLNYLLKSYDQIKYFFNEVTVPKGLDPIGTYAMAIGFDQGYFGMQVNSEDERRILFSVWSPQSTDDPNEISQDNKVILLEKGEHTVTNDFGGEGSGGQSYLVYPWVAGVAYQFKLEGKPADNNYSIFTAYFKDPTQSNEYTLIASWKRPQTSTYLSGIYSFLENFSPERGNITRKANFNNQYGINSQGKNIPVTAASFSYDDTAAQEQRFDYDGGVEKSKGYYLKNGGFFKTNVKYGDVFKKI